MRSPFRVALVAGLLTLSACGSAVAVVAPVADTAHSARVTAAFARAPGVAITYAPDLVPVGAQVTVASTSDDSGTAVTLSVQGLRPGRGYGAHAHTEPCGTTGAAAGPHYQNAVDPVQPSVDPHYANPDNEIWLDLTTDAGGAGTARTAVTWEFGGTRRPRSVVVHAMSTASGPGKAGTAGNRVACVNVDF